MMPQAPLESAQTAEVPNYYDLQAKYPDFSEVQPHEPLEDYVHGGFHPVSLGDTFYNGRYTVRHKLGFGRTSTVWLARDEAQNKWVALKIKKADLSMERLAEDPDIKSFISLEQTIGVRNPTGRRFYVCILDCFHHIGPNGTHICIVTEMLGPTVAQLLSTYNTAAVQETLRPDTILRASRQLLQGLAAAHAAGLAHGDVSPYNTAFTWKTAEYGDDDILDALGGGPVTALYCHEDTRPLCLPQVLVGVAAWEIWFDSPEEDIRLIDWADHFSTRRTRASPFQPFNLRSPETFFARSLNYKHDLWRAGSVILSLFFQTLPFGHPNSDADYLHVLVRFLGQLPPVWQAKCEEMMKRNEHQLLSAGNSLEEDFQTRWDEIIAKTEHNRNYEKCEYTGEDCNGLRCLLGVMKGLLNHDPDERLPAQEAAGKIRWNDQWNRRLDQGDQL